MRFGDVVFFKGFKRENLHSIVTSKLKLLQDELAANDEEKYFSHMKWEDSVVEYLIEKGYNKNSGFRALERVITQKIRALIAEAIVKGELKRGDAFTLVIKGEEHARQIAIEITSNVS